MDTAPGPTPPPRRRAPRASTLEKASWVFISLLGEGEPGAPVEPPRDKRLEPQRYQDQADAEQRGGDRPRHEDRVLAVRHRERLAQRHLEHRRQNHAQHDGRGLEVELPEEVSEPA